MYKKARCRCKIVALPTQTYCCFDVLVVVAASDRKVPTSKVKSRYLKVNRAYSISLISSNVRIVFWSWILKDCGIEVQEKEMKIIVLCSRPP